MTTEQHGKVKRFKVCPKFLIMACLLVALIVGIQPAFAGATADLIYSILGLIITAISKIIVGLLEIIINLLLQTMAINISDLNSWGLLAGFNVFSGIIKALAIGIASVAVLWQLTTILFGPYLDVKQSKSVGLIFTRTLIFIPLTYVIQPIAFAAFGELQKIYTAMLDGYYSASVSGFLIQLSSQINMDTFLNDLLTTSAAGATGVGTCIAILDALGAAFAAMVSTIVAAGFMILILWNLLKLIFEIVQRFVIMIVYVYLSPLATACGVIGNGEIPKKGLTLFVSSGILWILNVWCVGVACSLINAFGVGMAHGITGVFSWGFVTYGFLKIAQQLDDIFNAVGATNVKLNGSLLDELLSMRGPVTPMSAMSTVAGAYKSLGEKVLGKSTGKTSSNPVAPGTGNSYSSAARNGAAANGTSAAGSTAGGTTTRTATTAGKTAATTTEAGKSATGAMPPDGKNVPEKGGNSTSSVLNPQAGNNGAADKQIKGIDAALNMASDSEEKADKLKDIHDADPEAFNRPEVKDWMGKNQLGLDNENQSLVDTKYDPQTGDMSGMVATAKPDGKIALDKVTNMENTQAGAGNERAINAQKSSISAERVKAGEAQRMSDFGSASGAVPNGQNAANFSYTGQDGKQHVGSVERTGNGEFQIRTDTGEKATISAPNSMSATDVASLVNGSASESVKSAYAQHQAQTPSGNGSFSASGAAGVAAKAGIDNSAGGTVTAIPSTGNAPSGHDAAAFNYTDAAGTQHMGRLERNGTDGGFTMTTDTGESFNVSAPKDMPATDVAGVINGSASDSVRSSYEGYASQMSATDTMSIGSVAAQAGINSSAGGTVSAAPAPDTSSAIGTSGKDFATFSYTDREGVQHTAQMERLDTPSADHSEFSMVLDDGNAPVIHAPKDATAYDVASMVNGTASESVRASFDQYKADGTSMTNAYAATNVDVDKGGSVMSGTAFENSPNTVATLSHPDSDTGLRIERVSRGASASDSDVWSVSENGQEIGSVSVPRDSGAASVASRIMSDSGEEFAAVREHSGFTDSADPAVSFSASNSPCGPEPMRQEMAPNAPGERTNGSSWQHFGEVGFATDSNGLEQASVNYNAKVDDNMYTPASVKITDTGVAASLSGIKYDTHSAADAGKVLEVSGENIDGGSVNIVVPRNASMEDVVAAVVSGGDAAAGIKGVEEIRKAMGISETMNSGSSSALKNFFTASRKKSRINNKDNPVDAE